MHGAPVADTAMPVAEFASGESHVTVQTSGTIELQQPKGTNMVSLIALGILVAAAFYCIGLYNHLVGIKHAVAKAWANIDVLLKQRHDELPKLVEVCKQYKQFEQETLQKVIAARAQVHTAREHQNVAALGQAEGALRAGLGNLFAVAEAYPELKTNENFMQLQNRITALENGIADRRELYNDSVNINNVQIEVFPASIIAKLFNFGEKPLLEFSTGEKSDVDMKQLFD
jgi:LemA protein